MPPSAGPSRSAGDASAVILAAGRGTRMGSRRAKVLHEIGGLPLVTRVVRAVRPVAAKIVVVVGHEREAVQAALAGEGVEMVVQEKQDGTGHALACAAPRLPARGNLLVLAGDVPLLATTTLAALLEEHERRQASATVLTFMAEDPAGYGRIVRAPDGSVARIVEDREASDAERAVREVNSGTYAFEAADVLPRLHELPRRSGGEIYLTDVVQVLVAEGRRVGAVVAPQHEAQGVNTPEQLAAAARVLQERAPGPVRGA